MLNYENEVEKFYNKLSVDIPKAHRELLLALSVIIEHAESAAEFESYCDFPTSEDDTFIKFVDLPIDTPIALSGQEYIMNVASPTDITEIVLVVVKIKDVDNISILLRSHIKSPKMMALFKLFEALRVDKRDVKKES